MPWLAERLAAAIGAGALAIATVLLAAPRRALARRHRPPGHSSWPCRRNAGRGPARASHPRGPAGPSRPAAGPARCPSRRRRCGRRHSRPVPRVAALAAIAAFAAIAAATPVLLAADLAAEFGAAASIALLPAHAGLRAAPFAVLLAAVASIAAGLLRAHVAIAARRVPRPCHAHPLASLAARGPGPVPSGPAAAAAGRGLPSHLMPSRISFDRARQARCKRSPPLEKP